MLCPLILSCDLQPGKIAYSAHEYGPYVYPQGWFFARDFPRSLRRMMWNRWGFLIEEKKRAVWVGEFGSFYPKATNKLNRAERIAFDDTVAYIKKVGNPLARHCVTVWL